MPRNLRLPQDVDECILALVGESDTASYTSALTDLVRDSEEYGRLGSMDREDLALLIFKGTRIMKQNRRRPGSSRERRQQRHRLGGE